jgi:hypothetical protein
LGSCAALKEAHIIESAMKILISLIFLLSFGAYAQVKDVGWLRHSIGWLGGEAQCSKATMAELQSVSKHCPAVSGQTTTSLADIDHFIEEDMFQAVAKNSHDATICQQQYTEKFLSDPAWSEDQFKAASDTFDEIFPNLVELTKERDRLRKESAQMGRSATPYGEPGARAAMAGSAMVGIKSSDQILREAQAKLAAEAGQIDLIIDSLIQTIPLGNRKLVAKSIKDLVSKNLNQQNISPEKFKSAFNQGVKAEDTHLKKSLSFFSKNQNRDKSYKINNSMKEAFTQSGQMDAYLLGLNTPEDVKASISCRMRARYISGPFVRDLVGNGLLIASSFIPVVGEMAWGARAFGAGSMGARLAVAGVAATSVGATMHALQTSCFKDEYLVSASKKSCVDAKAVEGIFQEASMAQCATSVALSTLPIVRNGGRIAKTLASAKTSLNAANAKNLISILNSPGRNMRFFDGTEELTAPAFKAGESYTLVLKGRETLLVGRNTIGENGVIASSGSHRVLNRMADGDYRTTLSGAMRVNKDGSIDISGFSTKGVRAFNADAIEQFIKKIVPEGTAIRSTGDRLSTLPIP